MKMRRTYRSKKDAGGCIDHRDVLLSMDDKSSAFDAFYIQNIKQTKRELSCMGASSQHSVASNRVRKRKYVKRIVKEATPPPRESLSESVFLTPDKSIHVKKAPDLFDLLLESSPAWKVESKQAKTENLFDRLLPVKEGKTYTRRKALKKKINYSSSDSFESNKENSINNDASQDTTDIGSHKLIIEKAKTPSPKYDDSINKIVQNISILNNLHRKTYESMTKSYKNRLTKNFDSPLDKTSPLSSTPFTNKIRSKSIYQFSPIPIGDLEDRPNCVTVEEENEENRSIIFIPNDNSNLLTHDSPKTYSTDDLKIKKHSKPLFSSEDTSSKSSVDNEHINEVENGKITTISVETSETEPFRGFPVKTIFKASNEIVEEKNDSIILPSAKTSKGKKKSKECSNSSQNTNSSKDFSNSINSLSQNITKNVKDDLKNVSIEYSAPIQPFLGFSKVAEDIDLSTHSDVTYHNTEDIDNNKSNNEEVDPSYVEENEEIVSSPINEQDFDCTEKNIDNVTYSEDEESCLNVSEDNGENFTLDSQYVVRESLYNTCTSEDFKEKEPIIIVERMNSSLFNHYCKQMPGNSSLDFESDSDEYASFQNSENDSDNENSSDNENDIKNQSEPTEGQGEESLYHFNETVQEEEERCISFVTTRRRNERTNNSTIFVLNDSYDSNSSSDCDKTVLSNKKVDIAVNKDESKVRPINETIEVNSTILDSTVVNIDNVISKTETELESGRINDVSKQSYARECMDSSEYYSDSKPNIVLQPGKKWERSLSIYRRLTMNDPVNHSILDESDLHSKGRRYRQSVIHTMEIQDKGTLHNESIHSRRSTFVCKPSRSTIRIVKENNNSRISLSSTTVLDDLKGFLEDCDDTIVELSKLSIAESHDVTVLEKFHEPSRVATARDYVLRRCNQTEVILFDECYPDTVLKNCRKIGEGVYGEVFLWRATDGRARVMKIVPVAGTTRVNGEQQKDFHEIISEIVIAMELSALRAPIAEIERHFDEGKEIDALDLHSLENATDIFNEVLAVRCVYGGYPSRLLDLWELYDECKGSDNDNPAILPVDQQYIVLELANAGQDLESYQFNSAEQAYALFLQVAFGLAVGEESFQFEHRDLHWGNVLIQPTDQEFATFILRGRLHRVPRLGVCATIIDYSLSRLSLPLGERATTCAGEGWDSAALYNDLGADESLFNAVGDYQFEVYRLMRDKLGNEWKNFEPYTNILWLHYIVDKMITALRYKRTNTKTHKQYIAKLKDIKERILSYGSAAQFVLTDNEY